MINSDSDMTTVTVAAAAVDAVVVLSAVVVKVVVAVVAAAVEMLQKSYSEQLTPWPYAVFVVNTDY